MGKSKGNFFRLKKGLNYTQLNVSESFLDKKKKLKQLKILKMLLNNNKKIIINQ